MASSTDFISTAIKSIPAKKESLRKAFEDLQSYSASLSSFTLQWKDIEAYIDSVEKSIKNGFKEVELKEIAKEIKKEKVSVEEESVEATRRAELKSLCEKMDGKGLKSYIMNKSRNVIAKIRNEIEGALRFASDPAKMVLDAMDGFYSCDDLNSKEDKDVGLAAIRRVCIILLERLVLISPEIKNPVKERAMKLALEWKGKISPGGEKLIEIVAFMQILAIFGLVSAFDVEELLELFVFIPWQIDLFKALDLAEKVPDFVQKLASMGKQLEAVNFVYAFELVDKFPPGPLLKAYLKESKKVAQEIRKEGKHSATSQSEAIAKEIEALKKVIKSIGEYKLESEFASMNLENRISKLEQKAQNVDKEAQKAAKKRAAMEAPTPKPKQQPPKKKPRAAATTTTFVPLPTAPQRAPNQQQPQPGGPSVDWIPPYSGSVAPYSGSVAPYSGSVAPYSGSAAPYSGSVAPYSGSAAPYSVSAAPYSGSAGPYSGMAGPGTPYSGSAAPYSGSAAPYSGSVAPYSGSAGPYSGMAGPGTPYDHAGTSYLGAPLGYSVQCSPPKSHLYPSEHLLGSSVYDNKPVGYSGYPLSGGLPYHPTYYP
ncbi:FRIGIDA-like protein 1 [Tasmannia lanceolata]|uniref:FRIGIDA-like protein 1 n=1 Tax=Tasmannia lanceolata TaxID=3420 RepID=UPI004063175C